MNAIMTIDTLSKPALALDIPKNQTFDQWVEMGRSLAAMDRLLGWYVGDWWEARKPQWGEGRAEMAAQNIWGHSYSTVRQYGAVSRRFVPDKRLSELSFVHHREAVQLPEGEAETLLRRAISEGLTTRQMRVESIKIRTALGLFTPRVDDDPEHTELVDIARRWNRARKSVRQTFLDLANEANLEEIDP